MRRQVNPARVCGRIACIIQSTNRLEEIRRETLLTQRHPRIRDVRQGPDGLMYLVTDEEDGVLRLEPGQQHPASPERG